MVIAREGSWLNKAHQASHWVRKDILVLDGGRGELETALGTAKGLTCEATFVRRFEVACDLIESSPVYAAVVVDGTEIDAVLADRIFKSIKRKDRETPVLWLSNSLGEVPHFAGQGPEAVLASPCSGQMLSALLGSHLKGRFFPRQIREEFEAALVSALQDNFECAVLDSEGFLKSDAFASGSVSAMVAMMSEDIAGAIVVRGADDFFKRCHGSLLPGTEQAVPGDLAGEIANTVAGKLQRRLRAYGCEMMHAFPVIVQGHPISLGYGGPRRINFMQSVTTDCGVLNIELCLDWLDNPLIKREGTEEEALEPGCLSFL